jgi:hypothetical protein
MRSYVSYLGSRTRAAGGSLLLGCLLAVPTGRGEDADGRVKTVEISGAGTDVKSAAKDACRESVRQVVGVYVNAETRTENDDLIEDKVISLSSGFVEKSETLKKSAADGLVKVRIRATVRISKVIKSCKANKISVADTDAQWFVSSGNRTGLRTP